MAKETFQDLVFQLGDLARDKIANKAGRPRSMERVFKAEEALVTKREELASLEQQMNDEDAAYHQFVEDTEAEKEQQKGLVQKFRRAVDTVEGKSKALRKKIQAAKAQVKYDRQSLKSAQERHGQLEMSQPDPAKLEASKDLLKKLKIGAMRNEREVENLEIELSSVLTPSESQPGAEGILAHRRLLELEDQLEDRKEQFENTMADLDQAIAQKEEEIQASEDFLDQALYMLGEECYAQRFPDPALAALYPKLDKAK